MRSVFLFSLRLHALHAALSLHDAHRVVYADRMNIEKVVVVVALGADR